MEQSLNSLDASIGSLTGDKPYFFSGSIGAPGTVALGSGTLTTGGDNSSTSFYGDINGTGGLIKVGTGTSTLGGTYSGPTIVSGGTLRTSALKNSNVIVSSGATFGPNGPPYPTTPPYQNGNVSFNSGSTFMATLGSDSLSVAGNVSIGGAILSVNVKTGLFPAVGDSFTVIAANGGVSGTFKDLADNSTLTANGEIFRINYTPTTVVLTRTNTPTRPATLTALSKTVVSRGSGPFTLTVSGSNFTTNSVVRFNGSPLATTFVSNTQVTANVPASYSFVKATFTVTVLNPGFLPAPSNGLPFSVSVDLPNGTHGTANQRFVSETYLSLLARPVDNVGLASWSTFLDAGNSPTQLVQIITSSLEYRTDQVQAMYQLYLHRVADGVGLNGGIALLQSGGTVEQLATMIVSSAEYFQNRANNDNSKFLDALYQDALNRTIDPGAQTAFLQLLTNGGTRAQVATIIFTSPEYRQDLVQSYYRRFLGRDADLMGLNAWVGLLMNGGKDEAAIAAILGSAESYNLTAP